MSFLPPGFPAPAPEAMEGLRRNVMERMRTAFPPDRAELAVLVAADEAGLDLSDVDAEAIWASPPEDRAPVFVAIGQALGAMLD